MNLKQKYHLITNKRWNNKGTWQPLVISIVLIISLAIIHKAYWVSTTETNPEEVWENKKLIKNGNNWTLTFDENVGDSITFKGILRTAPKFEVYKNDTFVPDKFSEGEGLILSLIHI